VSKAPHLFERVAAPTGGRNVAWQPSRQRGQSNDGAVSVAALTCPRAAAQTGVHVRPLLRKPVVAGHRGGIASAVCAMAQPWTTVEWTVWPARPNDPTAFSRGRSSAEPTACRSGIAQTTSPVRKAHERDTHSHRSTEAWGLPDCP